MNLRQYLPGKSEKTHEKKKIRIASNPAKIQTEYFLNIKGDYK
jgi:hypothetical protein